MSNEKRREARYPARILARVVRKNKTIEFLTHDVSFRGVFIRTDAPPALRQLVKVELLLPQSVIVAGHAMVVHIAARPPETPKGEGDPPGIGLQFWGPLERAREWEQFVQDLRQKHRSGTSAAKGTDKIRRASERFKLAVEVLLDGLTFMTRDVSENGMAIRTDVALPVGTRAALTVRAGEQAMQFDVIVRRQIEEPSFRGLGVELVDMTAEQRTALVNFVRANVPSEDRIFVPPGDPKLH